MHTLIIEIAGCRADFSTTSQPIFELLSDYFRYYRFPADDIATTLSVQLEVSEDAANVPADARLVSRTGVVEFWEGPTACYLRTDLTLFTVFRDQRRAVGLVSSRAFAFPHLLVNTYIFGVLVLLLRSADVFHLHTAAVLDPHDRVTLICGAQRSGKSTLTTALAVSGWKAISDDGVLLRKEGGRISLEAFRRDFHIAADLPRQWPGLRSVEVRYSYLDRCCINGIAVSHAEDAAEKLYTSVDRVLFPVISDGPLSRLEDLDAGQAMLELIGQSMFFALWENAVEKQMQLLAGVLKGASFCRLYSGTDIWDNPVAAFNLLNQKRG